MKEMKRILTATLCAGLLIMAGGCDKTQKDKDTIDMNTIERLSRSSENIRYTLGKGFEVYMASEQTNWEWEKLNPKYMIGMGMPLAGDLIFANGSVMTQLGMYSDAEGPFPVAILCEALYRKTKQPLNIYVGGKFEFDSTTNTFRLGYNECRALKFTDKDLVLEIIESGIEGEDNEVKVKMILPFRGQPAESSDMYKLCFDSEREAYQYIIDEARKELGDRFNLNDYFDGYTELDNPWVNIDDVQKWLDQRYRN